MNTTIKMPLQKKVIVTDDKVTYGKQEFAFSSIVKAELPPLKNESELVRTLTVTYGERVCDFFTICYKTSDKSHVEAIEYIMTSVNGETGKRNLEIEKEIKERGFRKQCKVCGKVFCYTFEDLEKNKQLERSIGLSGLGQIAGALSGNYAAGATMGQTGEDQKSRIIDYNKCPSCGSRDLVDITDEELARINAQQNGGITLSTADELKKFKELLDMGIITQEEFDAKKKQLLGL